LYAAVTGNKGRLVKKIKIGLTVVGDGIAFVDGESISAFEGRDFAQRELGQKLSSLFFTMRIMKRKKK
jgi:hypothetical protein